MLGMQSFDDPALSVGGVPQREAAVVPRAPAVPRSRPFGFPSSRLRASLTRWFLALILRLTVEMRQAE